MRLSASLGAFAVTILLSQTNGQAASYGYPGGSPNGIPSDGSSTYPNGDPAGGAPAGGHGNTPIPDSNGNPGSISPGGPGSAPGSNANGFPGSIPGSSPTSGSGMTPPFGPNDYPHGDAPGGYPNGGSGNLPYPYPSGLPGSTPGGIPGGTSGGYPQGESGNVPYPYLSGPPGSSPTSGPGSNPLSNPNGYPGSTPNGYPTPGSGGVPYPYPNGAPGSNPDGVAPGGATCATLETTTTVFVTVSPSMSQYPGYPLPGGSSPGNTSPGGSGPLPDGSSPVGSLPDGSSPGGSSPGGPISGGSYPDGPLPGGSALSGTIFVTPSPLEASSAEAASVSPFTTITIDIWGPSDDSNDAGEDSPPSSTTSLPVSDYTGTSGPSGGSHEGAPGPVVSSSFAVPYPAQTSAPGDSGGFPNGGSPYTSGQQASGNQPFTTQAGPQAPPGGSTWLPQTPGAGGTITLSGLITITGLDGLPTIIEGGNTTPQGQSLPLPIPVTPAQGTNQGYPPGFPTDVWPLPSTFTGLHTGPGPQISPGVSGMPSPVGQGEAPVATCTTFTFTGADGLPTVVHSSWLIPAGTPVTQDHSAHSGPIITPAPIPGFPAGEIGHVPSGHPIPGSGQSDLGNIGQTTSTAYITIGTDGIRTIVYSTWVIPAPTITVSGIATSLLPNSPKGADITTRTSYTVIGSDGLPTFVDSTYVIHGPFNTAAPLPGSPGSPIGPSGGLPNGVTPTNYQPTSLPGYPSALPGVPGGVSGITTYTSYTVIGSDGLPTVMDSTYVIPGSLNIPTPFPGGPKSSIDVSGALPNGSPTPFTTSKNGLPGYPSGIPGVPGVEGGVTTCTTYTIIGSNGLPTVVDTTYVIPVNTPTAFPGGPGYPTESPGGLNDGLPASITTQHNGAPGYPYGVPGASGEVGVMTCTSFTIIGPDGIPTVVDTTQVVPGSIGTQTPFSGSPSIVSGALPSGVLTGIPGQITHGPQDYPFPGPAGPVSVTTSRSYTSIGTDGLPTIVEATWVIPGIQLTAPPEGFPLSGPTGPASGITSTSYTVIGSDGRPTAVGTTWVVPGTPVTATPVGLSSTGPGYGTSSTSYTVIGANGMPTVIDTTWVVPGIPATAAPAGSSLLRSDDVTTSTSYTAIGTNGLPTVVETTWVVPEAPLTGSPEGLPTEASSALAITAVTTAVIIGPDGLPTSVVQTIALPPSSGLGSPNGPSGPSSPQKTLTSILGPLPSGSAITQSNVNSLPSGFPSLSAYGDDASGPLTAIPPSFVTVTPFLTGTDADAISGTVTGTLTSTLTLVAGPGDTFIPGSAGGPPTYGGPLGNGASFPGPPQGPGAGYGPLPSEVTLWPSFSPKTPCITTTLRTSTWTNLISGQTTSYAIAFPLTTMATIVLPADHDSGKKVVRRQQISADASAWKNTTFSPSGTFPVNPSLGASLSSALSIPTSCVMGGRIGNTTVDFDSTQPGPLFNPQDDVWFSQGFLVATPSSQNLSPYTPTSGGQLVEFVPPALTNTTTTGSGDVAEIGVGPNVATSCFRFDFFGASLGCDAQGAEQWCEFEISAYRYNEATSSEESTSWSEVKRVPACQSFTQGGCQLTPIHLEGYTNITSVLITLRVGLELRTWWGDDFEVGWSDNSCDAAACRASAPTQRVTRETIESTARRGVWQWTPTGFEPLSDVILFKHLQHA